MKNMLSPDQSEQLLATLKARFEKNMNRHVGLVWQDIQAKLVANPEKLWIIDTMEETGGEPDVIDFEEQSGTFIFADCAIESPKGRRSLCYDHEALAARKEHKPKNSVVNMAAEMGIELINEEQYRRLQQLDHFDTKTSSWIKTPDEVRKLGGALFCDYRFGKVFTYHNGAESYYGGRAFRGCLRV